MDTKTKKADWIITEEGKFDLTSLQGKGPGAMLKMAHARNKPTLVLAGKVDPEARKILTREYPRVKIIEITPPGCSLDKVLLEAKSFLYNEISIHLKSNKT